MNQPSYGAVSRPDLTATAANSGSLQLQEVLNTSSSRKQAGDLRHAPSLTSCSPPIHQSIEPHSYTAVSHPIEPERTGQRNRPLTRHEHLHRQRVREGKPPRKRTESISDEDDPKLVETTKEKRAIHTRNCRKRIRWEESRQRKAEEALRGDTEGLAHLPLWLVGPPNGGFEGSVAAERSARPPAGVEPCRQQADDGDDDDWARKEQRCRQRREELEMLPGHRVRTESLSDDQDPDAIEDPKERQRVYCRNKTKKNRRYQSERRKRLEAWDKENGSRCYLFA